MQTTAPPFPLGRVCRKPVLRGDEYLLLGRAEQQPRSSLRSPLGRSLTLPSLGQFGRAARSLTTQEGACWGQTDWMLRMTTDDSLRNNLQTEQKPDAAGITIADACAA